MRRATRPLAPGLREDRETLMTRRHHNRTLLVMGVLVVLGLCSAGCQSNWVAAHPHGMLSAVASRRATRPCVESQRSYVIASSSPAAMEPALIDPPLRSAVTMSAPIIR